MNKLKYIAIIILLGACKKEGLLTYNTTDNIYFAYRGPIKQNPIIDTTNFTFAFTPLAITDSILQIPVAITGAPRDQDRTFSLTVNAASTAIAGKHYDLPSTFMIRAGLVQDTIFLKIKRPAGLNTAPVNLFLDLHPNGSFSNDLKYIYAADTLNILSLKINILDGLVAGSYWTGTYQAYFGVFSVKKVLLINEVAGMPLSYLSSLSVGGINLNASLQYFAITTSRYLQEQAAAGNTVYEEDGVTPMVMAPLYQ